MRDILLYVNLARVLHPNQPSIMKQSLTAAAAAGEILGWPFGGHEKIWPERAEKILICYLPSSASWFPRRASERTVLSMEPPASQQPAAFQELMRKGNYFHVPNPPYEGVGFFPRKGNGGDRQRWSHEYWNCLENNCVRSSWVPHCATLWDLPPIEDKIGISSSIAMALNREASTNLVRSSDGLRIIWNWI